MRQLHQINPLCPHEGAVVVTWDRRSVPFGTDVPAANGTSEVYSGPPDRRIYFFADTRVGQWLPRRKIKRSSTFVGASEIFKVKVLLWWKLTPVRWMRLKPLKATGGDFRRLNWQNKMTSKMYRYRLLCWISPRDRIQIWLQELCQTQ